MLLMVLIKKWMREGALDYIRIRKLMIEQIPLLRTILTVLR